MDCCWNSLSSLYHSVCSGDSLLLLSILHGYGCPVPLFHLSVVLQCLLSYLYSTPPKYSGLLQDSSVAYKAMLHNDWDSKYHLPSGTVHGPTSAWKTKLSCHAESATSHENSLQIWIVLFAFTCGIMYRGVRIIRSRTCIISPPLQLEFLHGY